jgi:DNA-binding NarL/FixJ family response regulator
MANLSLAVSMEEFSKLYTFSQREKEVIEALISAGNSEDAIAKELGVTRNTVRNHFQNIFEKAKCNSKSELMAKFINRIFDNQILKVLIIEDQKVESELLRRMLEKLSLKADIADDGASGLKMFKDNDYDLVITDMNLPELDGNDVIKGIRKISPFIPIIAVSGDENRLEEAGQSGVNIMWRKPVSRNNLVETLTKLPKSN